MVSLAQIDKVRELLRDGYENVPRAKGAEIRFGGPAILAKVERTFIKVFADGSVSPVDATKLADGCCSAISPCNYQRANPFDICEQCHEAGHHR